MKKVIPFFLVCITFLKLQAQVIEGIVYDVRTNETVPGVAIYLNGTSIITTSDKDGYFKLFIEESINTTLIFSHLSYESLTYSPPFDKLGHSFFLSEKVNQLEVAVVQADRISRENKMKVFKEHFLGTTISGKSCIIVNEEDIMLHFDNETNRLIAFATDPIIIENKYLGYRIFFHLQDFTIQYAENAKNMNSITHVSFSGTCLFNDLSPFDLKITTRRNDIYSRSNAFFWKSFASNTLKEAKFKIYNRGKQFDPDQFFAITKTASQVEVAIKPATNIDRHYEGMRSPVSGVIRVVHNGLSDSEIIFLTPSFSIDLFGNIDAIHDIIYYGDMGDQRLGDMLPLNYSFSPTTARSRR